MSGYTVEAAMNKKVWLRIGIIEAVILIVLAILLAVPNVNRTFNASDMEHQLGELREDAVYADSELSSGGWFVATPRLTLGYGVYNVTVEYESSADDSLL